MWIYFADISNSIFCVQVPSASGYRFRVRNGATVVGTVDKTVNRFSLVELGISNIAFATTYTVDVLLAFGGNLRPESEYGSACSISTPATPGTSRVISPSCGSTINNSWTTIFAQQVLGAQGYKFVVTNGVQTREFATANPRFQLPLLAGGAAASTAYTIRVDVLYASSYVQGTVLCTITTSPTATRQTSAALDIYEVNAYPNPYAETFKLNVNTSSEDQVGVRVYDMLGREVEARQASVAAITNLEIGSQYPSGVYNIIVTQGDNVKTVRVVKR
ncbi:MAG: T9SS type A sorting domain-containing protein [Flavobacterium sp.]|nr:T9SS type A sorting domain-containing protein [Flavobacterium sp.]